jgi:hypothetical protein
MNLKLGKKVTIGKKKSIELLIDQLILTTDFQKFLKLELKFIGTKFLEKSSITLLKFGVQNFDPILRCINFKLYV